MLSAKTIRFGDREVQLETGDIAKQANGSVVVTHQDIVLLVTAVAARTARPDADFFPLTVEYREKLASAGRVPGGYLKREGRIADHEVLTSRLIDRSIRPLFPKGFKNEVQVIATVLSAAPDIDPGSLGILGAAAALHLSDIPWHGPAGGLRLATIDGEVRPLPTEKERAGATLDLVVSAGPDGLSMVEGEGQEVSEASVIETLEKGEKWLSEYLKLLNDWREEVGREKWTLEEPEVDEAFVARVRELAQPRLQEALTVTEKLARARAVSEACQSVAAELLLEDGTPDPRVSGIVHDLQSDLVRSRVVHEGVRLDGRDLTSVRPISGRVGWLPRTHGSAVFTRGETQALVSCTLAPMQSARRVETILGDQEESFLLHYNFPPYSVGETRPLRGPGRREIGHGNLAKRALSPVLPKLSDFPYTLRVESDISESNGSSSMATVCGGALSMMDAGVPIRRPVAGIAMGLIQTDGQIAVLSDILGDEDHLGDMDFKVAGTTEGITAVQMDNKLGSLPRDVLERALEQARQGRLHILSEMARILDNPRQMLSQHAPCFRVHQIRPEKIRDLIGPRGATIQDIQATTGADISVNDDGHVAIYAPSEKQGDAALRRVKEVTATLEEGKYYHATVVNIKDFGAFVRIFPGVDGLVHISELEERRVERVEDVLKEGEELIVQVLGVERNGKVRLSRRAALGVPMSEVVNPPEK
ncbi:MAG: polyribonucleotide nucleotidyltransferase [Planctomycetota bacterium]